MHSLRLLHRRPVRRDRVTSSIFRGATCAIVVALTACAARDTNHPVGPAQQVDITLQPARIPPHQDGALMLSTVTGCYVEFVGKTGREPVYRFLLAPTARVPSFDQCLASLRTQPGVTGAELSR